MADSTASEAGRNALGPVRPRLPASAEQLRLPLYARSQERMAARWHFDVNAADASDRAEGLLAESPSDVDRLLVAAAVRSSRGDDIGALTAARKAADSDPSSARAHTTLAALLAHGGDVAGAARHAQFAVDLDPDDPAALYNRGLTSWSIGDHRAARADFERARSILGVDNASWWRRRRRAG